MLWQENCDLESEYIAAGLLDSIKAGDRVTILVHAGGIGKHAEWKRKTGRAVMRGPAGWVLNMGGTYGTPAVATMDNICEMKGRKQA